VRFVHAGPSPFAAGAYPASELAADLARATGGDAHPALTALLIRHCADLPDWLGAAGVALERAGDPGLPASRKTAFFLGGGKAMLNALYRCAGEAGVRIDYGCEVQDLALDGPRLAGVGVCGPGGTRTLVPRTAIACCGAAQANRSWLRAQLGAAAEGLVNRGTPFAQGQVLSALIAQGAQAAGDPRRLYLVAVDARSPADDGGIVTRVRGMPAGIVVDAGASRFHDEGADTASTRYSVWGRLLAERPGQIGWLILDARGERAAPAGLYPPLRADSPRRLAAALGLDPERLAASMAEYNAAANAAAGAPADSNRSFGTGDPSAAPGSASGWHTQGLMPPKSAHALPLTEPPFAAYPMRPGVTFSYYGLAVDETLRVRLRDGRPIDNLFAAGMIMAANVLDRGYLSGLALTIGMVFGRLAGEAAASHVDA
jgi:tricarballylate dehydrogenase